MLAVVEIIRYNQTLTEGTGVNVVSLHHDISTITGEEVILFTLAQSPNYCEAKMKS